MSDTKTYEFTLELTGVPELTDEFEGSVLKAGCDDATICMRGGIVSLAFAREAESEEEAVMSAVFALGRHVEFKTVGLRGCYLRAEGLAIRDLMAKGGES